jgi:hypothetical protein
VISCFCSFFVLGSVQGPSSLHLQNTYVIKKSSAEIAGTTFLNWPTSTQSILANQFELGSANTHHLHMGWEKIGTFHSIGRNCSRRHTWNPIHVGQEASAKGIQLCLDWPRQWKIKTCRNSQQPQRTWNNAMDGRSSPKPK